MPSGAFVLAIGSSCLMTTYFRILELILPMDSGQDMSRSRLGKNTLGALIARALSRCAQAKEGEPDRMRRTMRNLAPSLVCCLYLAATWLAPGATYTVTTVSDDGPGSLRQAMIAANASPDFDTIVFNIPGGGTKIILLQSGLPGITGPLTLDGYSQPGAVANSLTNGNNAQIRVELKGSPTATVGLLLDGTGILVRGLAINSFSDSSVDIHGPSNIVEGCFIGTDAGGTQALGGFIGMRVFEGSDGSLIGGSQPSSRNVISGNLGRGLNVGCAFIRIQGNFVGTTASGLSALGNIEGILFEGEISRSNLVGGTLPGQGNLISGNQQGIYLGFASSAQIIQGNVIGLDATGTTALRNTIHGIQLQFYNHIVGGTAPGARNGISGNGDSGIMVSGSDASGNVVQGNFIGTDGAGRLALPNAKGVCVNGGPHDTPLGGAAAGQGNVIAFNLGAGVVVEASDCTNNAVLGNRIFSNGRPGIHRANDGSTANDPGDADEGPNRRQNFPMLTAAATAGAATSVSGTLNSSANTTFRLEFFASAAADASGYGEGQMFLGATNVTTDGGGTVSFGAMLPAAAPAGWLITGTATDPKGNTSEFCPATQLAAPFVSVALEASQLLDQAAGVAWGDYDGDGYPDVLFTTGSGAPAQALYRNNGNGSFTRLTNGATATETGFAQSAAWADFDNDGHLDLFTSRSGSSGGPSALDALYRGLGAGQFTNVAVGALGPDTFLGLGCAWADYDRDGYLDRKST